jgi:nucleoside-diphosphate-sugar epimerase
LHPEDQIMRVFVTGATGFIGSAVVQELIAAGHQVVGLARSDAAATALVAAGAEPHRGALDDLDRLKRGAEAADGVIHLAFIHDFSRYAANGETDLRAVEAMGSALAGSRRPLVVTSGTTVFVPPGRPLTEDDAGNPASVGAPRVASEEAVMRLAQQGVRASVVRLPPSVHGDGDRAFVPALIGIARATGISAHVGDGRNRWPAVHRLDAARLFRLAMENASAGSRLHGVADEGVMVRDIAEVIGRRLNLPVVSKSPEEAAVHFGWLAGFLGVDCPASSAKTRVLLGWQPTHTGLIADLDHPRYFQN